MTNEKIIEEIAIKIYGEDTVINMQEIGMEIPLHTIQGWAQRGPYRVKKGEHGIECRLWKKRKRKAASGSEAQADGEPTGNQDFYLCKSYLFRGDQVELTGDKSE